MARPMKQFRNALDQSATSATEEVYASAVWWDAARWAVGVLGFRLSRTPKGAKSYHQCHRRPSISTEGCVATAEVSPNRGSFLKLVRRLRIDLYIAARWAVATTLPAVLRGWTPSEGDGSSWPEAAWDRSKERVRVQAYLLSQAREESG